MKLIIPFLMFFTACSAHSGANKTNVNIVETAPTESVVTSTIAEKGEISGNVKDEFGEGLPYASVVLLLGEEIIMGVTTDLDGNFNMKNIEPGTYDLEVNYVGYSSKKIEGVVVKGFQKIDFLMIEMPNQEIILLKPIIYLYPEVETKINVSMDYAGELTHTYPTYPVEGWNVIAMPDGTLWDENDKEYYALFWEGKPTHPIMPKDGFVIAGNETVPFLEEKLAELGLNRREANEFIMFWMPQMENSAFNFIHFASDAYENISKLTITPKPETIIRVMMLTKPLETKVEMPLQDITSLKMERKGFTIVEWGGSIINSDLEL